MTAFTVSTSVCGVLDDNGQLVLYNKATGNWHILNQTGAEFFEELRRTANVDSAAAVLTRKHSSVPESRIREDADRLIVDLVRRGLVEPSVDYPRGPSAVPMRRPPQATSLPWREKAVARIAFAVAVVLLRLPFRQWIRTVAFLKEHLTRRAATQHEALTSLITARAVSNGYPGRVACLELSLTAVIAGALLGRRVDWCFGVAANPLALHAWIEVDGHPVTDVGDDPISPTYRKVFSV